MHSENDIKLMLNQNGFMEIVLMPKSRIKYANKIKSNDKARANINSNQMSSKPSLQSFK